MFGRGSLFNDMRNDPFFGNHSVMGEFERMDRMMSEFSRNPFGMPSLMGSSGRSHPNQHNRMMPFDGGSMFGNMFGNMNATMFQMENNPNTSCFSSSKVISYSSTGNGAPKYYEATSETTQGPGGVRQVKKSERNSETGLNRMAIGHHIYDRGHVVERSMNRRTNEREEKHDFINLDEEEKDAFHNEWREKARSHGVDRHGVDRINHYRNREPRALTSSEYHRQNLERSRARHANFDEDRSRHRNTDRDDRRVRINSRHEEI